MSTGSGEHSDEEMLAENMGSGEDTDTAASPMKTDAKRFKGRRAASRMEEDSSEALRPRLKKRKSGELLDEAGGHGDEGPEVIAPAPGPDRPVIERAPHVHQSRRGAPWKGKERETLPAEPQRKRQRLSKKEVDARREKREADKRAWAKKGKTGQPNMVGLIT